MGLDIVEMVIISKHHQGYLDRFGGSTHEFYKYIEFLKEEFNMQVETETDNLLVLIK